MSRDSFFDILKCIILLSFSSYPNWANSPGLAHLQLDPKMLHLHFDGEQHKLGAAVQDLPRRKHRRPRLKHRKGKQTSNFIFWPRTFYVYLLKLLFNFSIAFYVISPYRGTCLDSFLLSIACIPTYSLTKPHHTAEKVFKLKQLSIIIA